MKILFLYPEHGRNKLVFPTSFAYLSAYIRSKISGLEIDYLDLNISNYEYLEQEYNSKQYDVIGITGLTSHYASIKKLILEVNKFKRDHTKIVVGGAIISSYPNYMIQHLNADHFILGEGEEAFSDYISVLQEGKDPSGIANVGYKEGNKVQIRPSRPLIESLDTLPWPDYKTFNYEKYLLESKGTARIFASRGCPFNCTFCYRLYGRKYRSRSVDNVLEEMKYLIKDYKATNFFFIDELFFHNRETKEEFCSKLIKRNYGVTWSCSLRVNNVDPKLLKLMRRAGCMQILFGVESGDQSMLKIMKKNTTVEQNIKAIKTTIDADILPSLNFIIGHPGETVETIKNTERLLEKCKCSGGLHFAQALPGAPLYEEIKNKGYIGDEEKYFISLQNSIEGYPLDFTGLGKTYIESEVRRLNDKFNKYRLKRTKRYGYNKRMYHLKHINLNYIFHLTRKYSLPKLLTRLRANKK